MLNSIYKLTAIGNWMGQGDLEFNMHFRQTAVEAGVTNQARILAELWRDGPYETLKPYLDNDYQLTMVRVRNVEVPTDGVDLLCDLNGSHSGETMPLFNAAVVSLRTDKIGRSYMGRVYIPAVPKDFVTNNSVTGAYSSGIGAFIERCLILSQDEGDASFELGVYSKILGTFEVVTGAIVVNNIGHQNRRKPGVGS